MIIAVGMKTLVMTDCLDKEGGDWKKRERVKRTMESAVAF